jgi:hypothetical protein
MYSGTIPTQPPAEDTYLQQLKGAESVICRGSEATRLVAILPQELVKLRSVLCQATKKICNFRRRILTVLLIP